mgnify:FL=1
MLPTFVKWTLRVGLGGTLLLAFWLGLVLASGAIPGMAIAKMDPPKTKVPPPNRLPNGMHCFISAGHWTCSAPDGSLWTCNSNPNGTINEEDCACVSGCKKKLPTPTPTPR